MHIKNRLKRWFKFRFAVMYPFGIALIVFSDFSDAILKIAAGWIVVGLLMRIWANGYAIKLNKLTTSGPYAFVRHPLYAGTALIMIGFAMMLKPFILSAIFVVIAIFVYAFTIRKEEGLLMEKFGEEYLRYKASVPAVIPALRPYRAGEKWPYSFKRLLRSKEYKTVFWIIIFIIALHLKNEFLVEGEGMDAKRAGLIGIALILASADIAGEFIKYRRRLI